MSYQQLSSILLRRGVSCSLISNDGFACSSVLSLRLQENKLLIIWRSLPVQLGCEIIYINQIQTGLLNITPSCSASAEKCLTLVFSNLRVYLGFADEATAIVLANCLNAMLAEAKSAELQQDNLLTKFRLISFEMSMKEEITHQQILKYSKKQCVLSVE